MATGHWPQREKKLAPIKSFHGCEHAPPSLDRVVEKALKTPPEERPKSAEEMYQSLEEARKVLDGIAQPYSYFDCSALLDVVCQPAQSDPSGRRADNARKLFRIEYEGQRAVASTHQLLELMEAIASLYFDTEDRDVRQHAGGEVDRCKERIAVKRTERGSRDQKAAKSLKWVDLGPAEKQLVMEKIAPFFSQRLRWMAEQLTPAVTDPSLFLAKLEQLIGNSELNNHERIQIADGFSIRCAAMCTEESSFANPVQKGALDEAGMQLFLIDENGVTGVAPPAIAAGGSGSGGGSILSSTKSL
jgi:hypothetical protein